MSVQCFCDEQDAVGLAWWGRRPVAGRGVVRDVPQGARELLGGNPESGKNMSRKNAAHAMPPAEAAVRAVPTIRNPKADTAVILNAATKVRPPRLVGVPGPNPTVPTTIRIISAKAAMARARRRANARLASLITRA